MRKKNAFYTVITSLLLQIVLIVTNLILPHFIIINYGSNVNGLIQSITQFLGYIVLLETGIGAVIKATLYKPLAKKDDKELSKIIVSTQKFFRKISFILIGYVILMCMVYPYLVSNEFDSFYTISLLIIISISIFMQYYFGLANQILIQSDQKGYIINICKIITSIVSTAIMIVMIYLETSIQIVKASGTIILIIAPIYYYLYVKKHYNLNRKVKSDKTLLSQRWDGFAHQISAFIHGNADIALLTFFSTLSEVSVYSIYSLITTGLKSIIGILTSSISATFGNIYANNEKEKFEYHFEIFDYFNLLIITFVFTMASFLITPFVKIYTIGVGDVNYDRLLFGILLVISEAIYCLRCSYSNIIFVVGDFKQTKVHGYIESGLNILLSLILINQFGLVGIVIGTLIGMLYRLIVSIIYVHKNIIKININNLIKKYLVNIISILFFCIIVSFVKITDINSYMIWIKYAITYSIIFMLIMLIMNLLFCKNDLKNIFNEYVKKRRTK